MSHAKTNPKTLSLKAQPTFAPDYCFGEWVNVKIVLQDANERLHKSGSPMPIKFSLLDSTTKAPIEGVLEIDTGLVQTVSTQGFVDVRLRFGGAAVGSTFIMIVMPSDATRFPHVAELCSKKMRLVLYKIVVATQPPELWYKDEGGRDKCIGLDVKLRDAQGALVTGIEMPLKCVLRYSNATREQVVNQKILKIQMESRNSISSTSGEAAIRVRIDEVSKNHQNQSFCIEIRPDLNKDRSGQGAATGAAFSGPITVKSKRVKKRRVDDGMGMAGGVAHGASGAMGLGADAGAGAGVGVLHSQSLPPRGCEEAVSGVIAWTKQVLEVVKRLEWTQVGFESSQQEMGKPDESKPIFKCIDPNGGRPSQLISSLLQQYSQHTMTDLHNLLRYVERYSTSLEDGGDGAADVGMSDPGGLAPPPLTRFASAGMQSLLDDLTTTGENLQLGSGGGGVLGGGMLSPPGQMVRGVSYEIQAGSIEDQVFFILAKMYKPDGMDDVGFAAFDKSKKLVGFYKEVKAGNGLPGGLGGGADPTQCNFFSLAGVYQMFPKLSTTTTPRTLRDLLDSDIRKKSSAVHTRDKYKDLVAMREEALMYHWSKCLMSDY